MNLSTQMSFKLANDNPSVMQLLKLTAPVEEHESCLSILDIFRGDTSLFAIPVVNQHHQPIGIVERHSFIEQFIKTYSIELYGKTAISRFMNGYPIIVDKETSIDDIAKIIIVAGMQHMVSGFIATENGLYIGIANGLDLLNEITQRKQANLFHLAHFDQLTMLPNRLLFMDRLEVATREAARKESGVALLYIDIDNFKNFNDSMGHAFGDALLAATAVRLSTCTRDTDTVARLSGDEFAILFETLDSETDLKILCDRIVSTMKNSLEIMGIQVFITASIGTATYPNDDTNLAGLLVKADAALYEAKRRGRNMHQHYTAGMSLYSLERMSLETDLRSAIERNEFQLFYQPQISINTEKLAGSEALIRWNHPKRGLLTPYHFIEIAEETGLIIPIGKWVLEEACRQHKAWADSGISSLRVSVNISAMQFYQVEFSETLRSIVSESGIQPSLLELELTESLCMHDVDSVLNTLNELHEFGIKLSIDDFGTGYSNLSNLRRFPIDKLKIDQSFIRNIEREPVNIDIVNAIVALGKSMSMELVAEGVETLNELAIVQSMGCQLVQGDLYSKPLSAYEFEIWIKDNMRSSPVAGI